MNTYIKIYDQVKKLSVIRNKVLFEQIDWKVREQVWEQVYKQVMEQVDNQVFKQVADQVWNKVKYQVIN